MPEAWLFPDRPTPLPVEPDLAVALERAAGAIARLDQALAMHPLLPAFLYRARLEAVRRQAAVDGHGIDPWHLAAILEGLRLRMDDALRIIDRCAIFEAARTALGYHQWITAPDVDQEAAVREAEQHLSDVGPGTLLGAAEGVWSWLQQGGTRPPIRAALIRFWMTRRLLRVPVPLTGTHALCAEAPGHYHEWVVCFLDALAVEAEFGHDLLRRIEHGWLAARGRVTARRSTSRAALAIDVLAAAPLLSATTLAGALGMSIKSATALLDRFVGDGIAIEVTHRSARRLFGLPGMAGVGEVTTTPRRPMQGRGRGRPPDVSDEPADFLQAAMPLPPILRLERPPIDYAGLDAAMAHVETTLQRTRENLAALGAGLSSTLPDRCS